jgi:hypothetical protein
LHFPYPYPLTLTPQGFTISSPYRSYPLYLKERPGQTLPDGRHQLQVENGVILLDRDV